MLNERHFFRRARRRAAAATLAALCGAASAAPTCDNLQWTAAVLERYPAIASACRGVYEQNGVLYAGVRAIVVASGPGRLTLTPLDRNGAELRRVSVDVGTAWRAAIGGKRYRARELEPGQELQLYIPEDRFTLWTGSPPGEEPVADGGDAESAEVPGPADPTVADPPREDEDAG